MEKQDIVKDFGRGFEKGVDEALDFIKEVFKKEDKSIPEKLVDSMKKVKNTLEKED